MYIYVFMVYIYTYIIETTSPYLSGVKMEEKIEKKKLIIEVSKDLHYEIKQQALWRNITIRKYILEAIMDRMKKDESYQ
jgi:hypothetical protein